MLPNSALPVRADHAYQQRQPKSKRPRKQQNAKPASLDKPVKKQADVTVEIQGDEVHLSFEGIRRYRIRGLNNNHSSQQLKVNILAAREGGPGDAPLVHLDTLDLYKARSRTAFIKATASELFTDQQLIKRDIGTMLLKLEALQLESIEAATAVTQPVELTAAEQRSALNLLKDPNLIQRILDDLDACGLAGEETGKLIGYLACVSRRLETPLALLIQSGSAAGKTTLMDAVLSLMPEEDQIRYSAMTGQSLYYMGQANLKHKILAIAEEQGVAQASYALKLLQSDGKLTIAAAGKSGSTGRQATETYSVEGPVMMFLTTTSEHPDPELQNRCLTIRVNESPSQTASIHQRQRDCYSLNGQQQRLDDIRKLHRNAQRLLESLPVVMRWAQQLTFRHDQTRMRRDHAKYLSLIAAITLLHQHQRKRVQVTKDQWAIESSREDVQLANDLISEVMGHSLDDLLPQTRQLLILIDDWVNQQSAVQNRSRNLVRFTQRQLRDAFGWSDFQIRHHLNRLIELEYVLGHRTGHGNGKEYELLYDGQGRQGDAFVLGLVDPAKLKQSK